MGLVIVNSAVDSLYFSEKGSLDETFFQMLRETKCEAEVKGEAVFKIGDEELI